MDMGGFVGQRKPLDSFDIPRMAHRIGVGEDHLRAFIEVEAAGRAYDRHGRPTLLFEPHVFYRNLRGEARAKAVEAGLAYPTWRPGSYPSDSYPRLLRAMEIDKDAALKACSIGLSQVLVENFSSVGYASPEAMWQAFMDDEEEHVEAMIRFILANGIDDDLREERWATVARVYNGPRYKENGYDTKMARAFARHRGVPDSDWRPDGADPARLSITDADALRAVQRRLIELGYPEVGKPDGRWGTKTRAAVLGFRADNGLRIVADVDDELVGALMLAKPRAVSEERASATAADLRDAGSRKVIAADKTEAAGAAVGVAGGVVAVGEVLDQTADQVEAFSGLVDAVVPLVETLKEISPWALLVVGAFVVWQQIKVKSAAVQDYREGKYVGR